MDKIRIVNLFITRKCNLQCSYCGIVRNYNNKPDEYPDMKYYYENEMTTKYVIELLTKFKQHNPDIFIIIYGGEPVLRKDLPDIINFCNHQNIHYTIISNNTPEIQPLIKTLFDKTNGNIKGFTSSIDPVITQQDSSDRFKKSISGLKNLLKYKVLVKDIVAEITIMKQNIPHIYNLVKKLSDYGFSSDITFVDIAKTPYYDFSNVESTDELVDSTPILAEQFQLLCDDDNLNIHMKNTLLMDIWNILPSNMDCGIEKDLHNISIDADGSIRLCSRIRGIHTPNYDALKFLFNKNMEINPNIKKHISKDKKELCKLCNHTCLLMSQYKNNVDELIHTKIRK